MLEQLLVYERDLFFALNGSDSAFWDQFMWIYSGKVVWLPLALFVLFVLSWRRPWRETILLLLGIALTVTLCDQFASHLCKPLFCRFRPTHHPDFMDQVRVLHGYRSGLYGFISSHAANAFGFALFLGLVMRDKMLTAVLMLWALVNAYTRVYLGVHFISDVAAGALAGLLISYLVYRLYRYALHKMLTKGILPAETPFSPFHKRAISSALLLTVVVIALISWQS